MRTSTYEPGERAKASQSVPATCSIHTDDILFVFRFAQEGIRRRMFRNILIIPVFILSTVACGPTLFKPDLYAPGSIVGIVSVMGNEANLVQIDQGTENARTLATELPQWHVDQAIGEYLVKRIADQGVFRTTLIPMSQKQYLDGFDGQMADEWRSKIAPKYVEKLVNVGTNFRAQLLLVIFPQRVTDPICPTDYILDRFGQYVRPGNSWTYLIANIAVIDVYARRHLGSLGIVAFEHLDPQLNINIQDFNVQSPERLEAVQRRLTVTLARELDRTLENLELLPESPKNTAPDFGQVILDYGHICHAHSYSK